MNCPRCNEEMTQQGRPETTVDHGTRIPGREYTRILYWCEKDDVWASVETPKLESATQKP